MEVVGQHDTGCRYGYLLGSDDGGGTAMSDHDEFDFCEECGDPTVGRYCLDCKIERGDE